jgi:hypothetical protein
MSFDTMKILVTTLTSLALFCLIPSCKKSTEDNQDVAGTKAIVPSTGVILLSPTNTTSSALQVLDSAGRLIKNIPVAADVWNFQKWIINGKTRYTYAERKPDVLKPPSGTAPCYDVILDENFKEIKRVSIVSHGNKMFDEPAAYDGHEFILVDDDHFIAIAYEQKTVTNIPDSLRKIPAVKIVAPVIQEVQNGSVIFEWDGSDYAEFYGTSVENNHFSDTGTVYDYMHINSVCIDPRDQNLVCSFRNLNQVIKINRHTGDIIWRLGGSNSDFPMTNQMYFLRQHHATITDNGATLLLHDNGEAIERPYTRILEFNLDESAKAVVSFKSFNVPGNTFTQYTGSAQKIGSTYFIGCGTAEKFMQVNYNTGEVLLNMKTANPSYRALRY